MFGYLIFVQNFILMSEWWLPGWLALLPHIFRALGAYMYVGVTFRGSCSFYLFFGFCCLRLYCGV